MGTIQIGFAAIAILVLLVLLGVHVGISLAIVGAAGFCLIVGFSGAMGLLTTGPYEIAASYELCIIPLFILMGLFAYHGGLSKKLYKATRAWTGKLPGNLVIATIASSAIFGAISGSSLAAAAIFTKVGLPEMLKHNFDKRLSSGAIAAAGTMAALIPPSTLLVFIAIITEQSVGRLLIAGILPGILSAVLYVILIMCLCYFKPNLGSVSLETVSLREKFMNLKGLWAFPVLVILVLGGLFVGFFTATEAAAIGAFGSLCIALTTKEFKIGKLVLSSLLETVRTTAMIFLIIIGATIFSRFLAVSRIPVAFAEFVEALLAPRIFILLAFLAAYVFLGTFLDPLGMLAITLPIVYPIIEHLGFDTIWFSILLVKMMEIGLITPPLGMNVYVVSGAAENLVSMEDVFRGVIPFLLMDFITLSALIIFPNITLFLPNSMFN